MQPNLLLSACGVGAHGKDILHLLVAHKHDVTSNIPPDPLAAGRTGEGPTVRPKLGKGVYLGDGEAVLNRCVFDFRLVAVGYHGWELREEFGLGVTGCESH